jgi:flagellar protein FlaI
MPEKRTAIEEPATESIAVIEKEIEQNKLAETDIKKVRSLKKTVTTECKLPEIDLKKKLPIKEKIRSLFQQQEQQIEKYARISMVRYLILAEWKAMKKWNVYWVSEPYTFVVILFNPERNNHLYYVVEPELTDFEKNIPHRDQGSSERLCF